jgi:hypothetical protein
VTLQGIARLFVVGHEDDERARANRKAARQAERRLDTRRGREILDERAEARSTRLNDQTGEAELDVHRLAGTGSRPHRTTTPGTPVPSSGI